VSAPASNNINNNYINNDNNNTSDIVHVLVWKVVYIHDL